VYGILIAIHLMICLALIISVLLQSSKGEGLAGAFGGSAMTGTVFGGRGAATFLSRATTGLAIAFFASAIVLSFLHPTSGSRSAPEGTSAVEQESKRPPEIPEQPVTQDQTQNQPVRQAQPDETPIEQINPNAQKAPTGDSGKK